MMTDPGLNMTEQKSTDALLMELMSLALDWQFEGSSEPRGLVKRLYQAAQEERRAANSTFLRLQEQQTSLKREIDSLRAKLACAEATTEELHHVQTGKKTLDEVEKEGTSNAHSKQFCPQQSLLDTGVASKSSNSANRSIDGELPTLESLDPRKRRKTSQAASEPFPPLSTSPRASVPSSATQPQAFAASGRLPVMQTQSEPKKDASIPKPDFYRPTPTGLESALCGQRKPVCGTCYREGRRQECDGGQKCQACRSRRLDCVYYVCRRNCRDIHCTYIHDDQWDSEKESRLTRKL